MTNKPVNYMNTTNGMLKDLALECLAHRLAQYLYRIYTIIKDVESSDEQKKNFLTVAADSYFLRRHLSSEDCDIVKNEAFVILNKFIEISKKEP